MKALFISGFALAILMSTAQAQTAPPAPPDKQAAAGMNALPPHYKAARILLQDGDAAVDVKCADDEPMKVCADITLQILEKLVSLPKPKS